MKINLENLVKKVCNISINAGLIILSHYNIKKNIYYKKDKSPLTEADLDSNKLILNSLKKINKNLPVLSEESLVEWKIRKKWKTYWLVDPLDGTKEFIKKNGEFTVNIALINDHKPILGVIYAPALSTLYFAIKKRGSYKLKSKKEVNTLSKSIKLKIKKEDKNKTTKIFGSRSHNNNKFNIWVNKNFSEYKILQKGSSIKFCELAEGKADLYPRLGPTCEWDIAAGDLILTEAGGSIKTFDNENIMYNSKESVINPNFIARGKE